jgi:hypothetical protein
VSTAENKASIKMTAKERFFAAACLQHRAQERDPAYQAVLAERMKRMDAGQNVALDQFVGLHEALEAEGI